MLSETVEAYVDGCVRLRVLNMMNITEGSELDIEYDQLFEKLDDLWFSMTAEEKRLAENIVTKDR